MSVLGLVDHSAWAVWERKASLLREREEKGPVTCPLVGRGGMSMMSLNSVGRSTAYRLTSVLGYFNCFSLCIQSN